MKHMCMFILLMRYRDTYEFDTINGGKQWLDVDFDGSVTDGDMNWLKRPASSLRFDQMKVIEVFV